MSLILILLLISLVILLCMLVLIATATASVMGREQPVKQYEPTCGGCHYIVKDVNARSCEICGAEFTQVGINMPPAQILSTNAAILLAFRQISAFPLAIWTALLGFLALLVIVPVGEAFWPYESHLTSHIEARPRSGGWESLSISSTHDRFAKGRAQQENPQSLRKEVIIELRTPKGPATMHADLVAPKLTCTDPAGKVTTNSVSPTSGFIADFMRSAGIHSKQAAHESPFIAELVAKATEPPDPDAEPSSTPENTDSPIEILNFAVSGGHWEQPTSLPAIAVPAACGLWLLGTIGIFIKQHGRRRRFKEQLLNPPSDEVQWEPPAESQALIDAAPQLNEAGPALAARPAPEPDKTDPAKGPKNISDAA